MVVAQVVVSQTMMLMDLGSNIHWELGVFSFFRFLYKWSLLNQVPQRGASLLEECLSCAAGGGTDT